VTSGAGDAKMSAFNAMGVNSRQHPRPISPVFAHSWTFGVLELEMRDDVSGGVLGIQHPFS